MALKAFKSFNASYKRNQTSSDCYKKVKNNWIFGKRLLEYAINKQATTLTQIQFIYISNFESDRKFWKFKIERLQLVCGNQNLQGMEH